MERETFIEDFAVRRDLSSATAGIFHHNIAAAEGYNGRGDARLGNEEIEQAILDFAEALRVDPNNAEACNNLGRAFTLKKDFDRAIEYFGCAIQIDAKYAWAYYNRGRTRFLMKDFRKALSDYSEAIRLDPGLKNAENHTKR